MPVPQNPLFEQFLSSTRIVDRESGSTVVLTASFGRPTLYIEYPESQLPFDAVVRLIKKELKQRDCTINERVAIAVIANTVASRPDHSSNIEHLNQCLSNIHSAALQQYVVLPIPCRRDYEVVFGPIKIHPFDSQRLLYWATRGGSSFPIDVSRLAGNVALERAAFPTSLLNWDVMSTFRADRVSVNDPEAPLLIRDAYYASVFEQHLNESMELVRQDIAVLEAGALLHFNVESFFKAPLVERLGLFHWQSATGQQRTWAVRSTGGFSYNLLPPQVLTQCRDWLAQVVGFRGFDPTKPLDNTTATFCSLLQRAHDHRLNRRTNEASLHFVIALDYLLGTEGRLSDSVADRAAVVTHRGMGHQFEEQVARVKAIYNARSKYVHRGEEFAPEYVTEAEQIALQTLWALLAVSGAGVLSTTEQWLNKINYVVAALRDGRAVLDEEFRALGVTGLDTPRVAPNYVVDSPSRGA